MTEWPRRSEGDLLLLLLVLKLDEAPVRARLPALAGGEAAKQGVGRQGEV
jgi:hypothetical protein